jgi:hypothetical protein
MPDPTYAALTWDAQGKRLYYTGVSNGVLFVYDSTLNSGAGGYKEGVAWNGLTAVTEKPTGAEATPLYADNIKYLNLISNEDFAATIEAYMYPDEFAECDGSAEIATGVYAGQQKRKTFALSYMTKVGNDVDGDDHAYQIHIVYGCLAAPTEVAHNTIGDSPEAATMSWEISTTPINVTGKKPTAHIIIDSKRVNNDTKMGLLKAKLWGSSEANSSLPDISWLITTFGAVQVSG